MMQLKGSRSRTPIVVASVGAALLAACAVQAKESPEEQRREITTMAQQTLDELYKEVPGAKAAVNSAAGYGAFSNFGMKILVLGTGTGTGVVADKRAGKKTFMKMVQIGGGIGIGGKQFEIVLFVDMAAEW